MTGLSASDHAAHRVAHVARRGALRLRKRAPRAGAGIALACSHASLHLSSAMYELQLAWKGASLSAHLGSTERDPAVVITVTGVKLHHSSPSRVFVECNGKPGAARFILVKSTEESISVVATLLVASHEDGDDLACELSSACGRRVLSSEHKGDLRISLNDTSALPSYRVRCLDSHRDEAVEKGALILRGFTAKHIPQSCTPPILTEDALASLDDYYQEALVMERHAMYAKTHFECDPPSLAAFQTLWHPARGRDTRGGQKQLCVEDGLLFNHPPPDDCKMSEDTMEAIARAACAACCVCPHDLVQKLAADPTWRRTPADALLHMRVLGCALRVARPPYVADHYLDVSHEHDVLLGSKHSSTRFTRTGDGDDGEEARGIPADALVYIDLANSLDGGDCEDGEKIALDIYRALRAYRGTRAIIRCLAYLATQFEGMRIDNRCERNECHVLLGLVPWHQFCDAAEAGCVRWLERNTRPSDAGPMHDLHRALLDRVREVRSACSDNGAALASAFIEGLSAQRDPPRINSRALQLLLIESTALTDPLTSFFREPPARSALLAEMMHASPRLEEWFIAEITNNSGTWGGRLPEQGVRSHTGPAAGDPSDEVEDKRGDGGVAGFSFYRDVTGGVLDLHSPILGPLQESHGVGILRAIFAPQESGADGAGKIAYGVPMEAMANGQWALFPTSYVDVKKDMEMLRLSKRLLDDERQMARNLTCAAPAPGTSVLFSSMAAANAFYMPHVKECAMLFEQRHDARVSSRQGGPTLTLEVEERRLCPDAYAALHTALRTCGASFTYSVSVIGYREEVMSTRKCRTPQASMRRTIFVYVARM